MPVEADADGIIVHMKSSHLTSRLLIGLWLAGQIAIVDAARVADLYTAEVPAAGSTTGGLSRSFDDALRTVLVKVTGRRSVVEDSVVMGQFAAAEPYVQQYRTNPDGTVWVLFDRVAVRRALDGIGQPVWGEERPATLVWLVLDYGTGRRDILGAEQDVNAKRGLFEAQRPVGDPERQMAVRDILQFTALERGLPLVLPIVDSEELGVVSIADVWGGFTESLTDVSRRYGVDAILVGRARVRSVETARVRWTLMRGGERIDWDGGIADGPDRIADYFAGRLATSSSASDRMELRVDGVDSLDDYGRLSRYLSSLDVIEDYSVDRVSDQTIVFSLIVRGDADRLMRSIALQRVLQLVDQSRLSGLRRPPSVDSFERSNSGLHYALISGP